MDVKLHPARGRLREKRARKCSRVIKIMAHVLIIVK
jgi:hypothetical protein